MPDGGFRAPDGRSVPTVTADEMRAVDRVAVEEVGLGLASMMENAGRTLATLVRERADGPVVVLAGGGGNGGGGLAAARHLANHGVDVRVVLDRSPSAFSGVPADQLRVVEAMGVPMTTRGDAASGLDGPSGTDDAPSLGSVLADASLAVDAVVGYGLAGAPRGRVRDLVEACNARAGDVVSLDVPSGVDATTGETPGVAVAPDLTVTLALPKAGLVAVGGDVVLADIAIPATVFDRAGVDYKSPFDGRYCVPLARVEE